MFLEKNFIASAVGLRTVTATFDVQNATTSADGKTYIPAGSIVAIDEQKQGISLDDVYFRTGEETKIGAVIVAGHLYEDRLPEATQQALQPEEFTAQGLFFETAPTTTVGEGGDTPEPQPEPPADNNAL